MRYATNFNPWDDVNIMQKILKKYHMPDMDMEYNIILYLQLWNMLPLNIRVLISDYSFSFISRVHLIRDNIIQEFPILVHLHNDWKPSCIRCQSKNLLQKSGPWFNCHLGFYCEECEIKFDGIWMCTQRHQQDICLEKLRPKADFTCIHDTKRVKHS
jgi:hypothetical protein